MSGPIFINYRRSTSAHAAGRLADQLARHFDRAHIFVDVDGIEPGIDFVKALHDQVAQCSAFIAVIGPHWTELKDAAGHRCLDNPNDYVRIEIEAALTRNIRVIPILVDGAQMPAAEQLPDSIKAIARRNAVELTHARFGAEVDDLARTLQRALGLSAKDPAPPEPDEPGEKQASWAQFLFSFQGRVARKPFWLASLAMMIVLAVIYALLAAVLGSAAIEMTDGVAQPTRTMKGIYGVASLPFYWPALALFAKRLHDFGQGPAFVWPVVILGAIYFVLDIVAPMNISLPVGLVMTAIWIVLGCIKGMPGANAYGPDPLARIAARQA